MGKLTKRERTRVDADTINRIRYRIMMIANEFNLDKIKIYSSQRLEYVKIRHCITYILVDILKITFWCVADITRKKSHQTVLKATEKFRYDMGVNCDYKTIFNKCIKYFGDIDGKINE